MSGEKKKVDEAWKRNVQEEKQKFAQEPRASKQAQQAAQKAPLPEADFTSFVSGLATQALIHLGEIENPLTKKKEANLDQARYVIDLLQMLEQKTKGNLSDEESHILAGILDDLRWRFVRASNEASK